jgi:hypothetical protein
MLYELWWDHLAAVLAKYEEPECDATSVVEDYAVAARVVPRDVLVPVYSEAFRSLTAPPLSELIASIYEPLPPEDRTFFWGPLLEAAPGLRRARPDLISLVGPISSGTAASITAQQMDFIIEQAQSLAPDLYSSLVMFLGYYSGLTFGLPLKTKAAILTILAPRAKQAQAEATREREEKERLRREEDDRIRQQGQTQQRQEVQRGGEGADNFRYVEEVIVDPYAAKAEANEPATPEARYPSAEIFRDSEGDRGPELEDNDALQANSWYQVQVSIGPKIRGIYGARRPIRDPRQKSNVDILVTAYSDSFEVAEPASRIVLPPRGDSVENAQFRVRAQRASTSASDWLSIEFRLFYQFNLLEIFSIRAVVCAADAGIPVPAPGKPVVFDQQRQMEPQDFDLIPPRALHVFVEAKDAQYRLTFTFKCGQDSVSFPRVTLPLNGSDLENRIAGVRKRLFGVCSSDILGARVAGDPSEFEDHLRILAEEGSNIWSLLFDGGGSISEIGHWLKTNPLPMDSAIQVSIDPSASNFVVAWALLYDRWEPDAPAQLDGFWGLRYIIEQRPLAICVSPAEPPAMKEIGAMVWKFDQTKPQITYITGLLDKAVGVKPFMNGPIDTAVAALACLNSCSSDLVYFYSHGYTGLPNAERFGFSVQDFMKVYAKLPPETKKALRYTYDDIQNKRFDSDGSYIELSSGKIQLDDLYKRIPKLSQRPIVLLNMCDSAQVIPSLSRSFIQFFLSRQARAVLGTECPIRPVFADYVGRALVKSLLEGVPIGRALLNVRRDSAEQKNLLGLAYTLFGSAEAGFQPVLSV